MSQSVPSSLQVNNGRIMICPCCKAIKRPTEFVNFPANSNTFLCRECFMIYCYPCTLLCSYILPIGCNSSQLMSSQKNEKEELPRKVEKKKKLASLVGIIPQSSWIDVEKKKLKKNQSVIIAKLVHHRTFQYHSAERE